MYPNLLVKFFKITISYLLANTNHCSLTHTMSTYLKTQIKSSNDRHYKYQNL